MARRDERAYPWWICERGATKPGGLLRENPPGGASFVRGRRWLVAYPDLSGRGCSQLAVLATAKIRCRRPTFNFETGSVLTHVHWIRKARYAQDHWSRRPAVRTGQPRPDAAVDGGKPCSAG